MAFYGDALMSKNVRREMKSILRKSIFVPLILIPVIFLGLPIGILIFAFGKAYVTNNQILSNYEQEFNKISHPSNTSEVASEYRVTRPPANGSHCFYFVGEVRRFSGDKARIKTFYSDKAVELKFLGNSEPKEIYLYGLDQFSNWHISQDNLNGNFYLVYRFYWSVDEDNSLDLRCS